MPFEQRTSTYFVCTLCKFEYEITGNAEYGKIYKCKSSDCNHEETFLGLQPTSYTVSKDTSTNIFKKIWHNHIFQGIFAGALLFIIFAVITALVFNNFVGDLKEELREIENTISQIEGGG